jgi:serine O-acetyltransferase
VIGAASIGENVTIFQGVTIGTRYADSLFNVSNRPIIEDGVMLGAGSKVLRGIIVGAGASVASNSLVLDSVPAGTTVIGVPASIKV